MAGIVIIGAQWGDEGKGKIVDIFTERADVVVRFAGGPNAGHTLVVGKDKLVGAFKLCLATTGSVSSVTMLKSSGFPDYDAKILREMRTVWRYQPYTVDAKAVPVCTAVTFIYASK